MIRNAANAIKISRKTMLMTVTMENPHLSFVLYMAVNKGLPSSFKTTLNNEISRRIHERRFISNILTILLELLCFVSLSLLPGAFLSYLASFHTLLVIAFADVHFVLKQTGTAVGEKKNNMLSCDFCVHFGT